MKRFTTFLSLAMGLAILLSIPSTAQASGRLSVGLNFGANHSCNQRVWVPDTYVMRTERVLVRNAHYVNQWVPPIHQTRYDRHGRPYTVCVRHGHHEKVLIPARYEMRTVRERVPGYWRAAPVVHHRPLLSLLFGKHQTSHHSYNSHSNQRGHSSYKGNSGHKGNSGRKGNSGHGGRSTHARF